MIESYYRNALAAHQKSDYLNAKINYKECLKINPNDIIILNLLASVETKLKNFDIAINLLNNAIKINCNSADTFNNRGTVHNYLNQHHNAINDYSIAIKINPNFYQAHVNRGISYFRMKNFDNSLADLKKAITIDPRNSKAYFNRGNVYSYLHQYAQALSDYNRAIEINKKYIDAYFNRATAYKNLKFFNKAIKDYEQIIKLDPSNAHAQFNKGITNLLQGNFNKNVWKLYEWRFKCKDYSNIKRNFSFPQWNGKENLKGKKILIYAEQGLGDTIQFLRYLKLVKSLGADVYFEVQKKLIPLLSFENSYFKLIKKKTELINFDFHCPLLSLPLIFDTKISSIPNEAPYIFANDSNKLIKWKKYLGEEGFKIGICWEGSGNFYDNNNRSFNPELFQHISTIKNVRLISLQKNNHLHSLSKVSNIEILPDNFDNKENAFLDSAAVMKCCDLIISCDTSIGHLSGAMGIRTWLFLPYIPDWRWLLDIDYSPWYKQHKIFRQNSPDNWRNVFSEAENLLKKILQSKRL